MGTNVTSKSPGSCATPASFWPRRAAALCACTRGWSRPALWRRSLVTAEGIEVVAYIARGSVGKLRYMSSSRTNLGPIRKDVSVVWDLAAGALLVAEAGGVVTDVLGGNTYLSTGDIVAAGPDMHSTLLEITRSAFG